MVGSHYDDGHCCLILEKVPPSTKSVIICKGILVADTQKARACPLNLSC